jgi:sterol desaturase/sphingolipid hydroxylase (fatty acid hydroxylase superfamily)
MMADVTNPAAGVRRKRERVQDYAPPEPVRISPLFRWPISPVAILRWIFAMPGYLLPYNVAYFAIALATWVWLTPSLETMATVEAGWIGWILLRNAVLLTLVVGAWHLRLYVQKAQGTEYKYNGRWLATDNDAFLFRDQLKDNVFWTFASGVPIWTAFEVTTLWAQANGYIPGVDWAEHPVYFAIVLLLIPIFREAHFYCIHRLIHWPPLYRTVHKLHHANVNPGPWSGLSMHPIEHVLYFSGVLVHWIVPSHPLHVIFHLQHLAYSPAQGHNGFDKVKLSDGTEMSADHYGHYLHHKYFEVNYGDGLVPLDKLFDTFHDGTPEGDALMQARMKKKRERTSP